MHYKRDFHKWQGRRSDRELILDALKYLAWKGDKEAASLCLEGKRFLWQTRRRKDKPTGLWRWIEVQEAWSYGKKEQPIRFEIPHWDFDKTAQEIV